MEEFEVEFVAYSRLLLRSLMQVKEAVMSEDKDKAIKLLEELIEDTRSDIEE